MFCFLRSSIDIKRDVWNTNFFKSWKSADVNIGNISQMLRVLQSLSWFNAMTFAGLGRGQIRSGQLWWLDQWALYYAILADTDQWDSAARKFRSNEWEPKLFKYSSYYNYRYVNSPTEKRNISRRLKNNTKTRIIVLSRVFKPSTDVNVLSRVSGFLASFRNSDIIS